ncbi:lipopolysaccharide core heptose(II) kinase RfaY [Providencia manganoxydans]|uniref:Lipopolysaccharide core biosynthesis protein n=1 Tax=Providencia manganoxydans TaxID=2923283 RepID=A0ABX7AEM0_9GAMM|nr:MULTISPECIES: lipopolysaccharide core heptose(II) kinase RfaY [Providencia]MDX4946883.1 lipopolysaccharide core heptose(II) kinase RfaY [Providencia manganoxydans]QQO62396.1 lipopolysaccharide core biosynthesis protein [Providencia manganoxydans]HEF8771809.1 lipopolysaccharide core biosynthesis protein [Providencia stuartii]
MQKIITTKRNGYFVYQKQIDIDFAQIIDDYIQGKITGQILNSGNVERSVARITVNDKHYIIKCEKERDRRLEKRIMRVISGPYFSRLFHRLVRAQDQGCQITNDIYFVAEKIRFREALETWIIAEYVEGTVLSEINDIKPYYTEIAKLINKLHSYGLASNDIHAGNFVLTESGLKIIDLSDFGNFAICKANDLVALKRFYGIEPEKKSVVYRFISLRNQIRHWSRKMRGKKTRL